MKKLKYLLLVCLLMMPVWVHAEELTIATEDSTVTTENDTTVKDNYFYNNTLDADTKVNHNAFVAGNNTSSLGTVNGLLFAAGNNVTVSGVDSYAFVAGNSVSIDSEIHNDLFAAGNTVTISKDAKLNRDVYAAGSNVSVNTDVKGNVFIGGNNVTFNNTTIDGNVYVGATNITFTGTVKINGTLKYNSNAIITGKDKLTANEMVTYESDKKEEQKSTILTTFISILMMYLVAIVVYKLFPVTYDKMNKKITGERLLKNCGFGLLMLIAIPILALLLCVTRIGLSLGLIIIALYGICLYLGLIPISTLIGNVIDEKIGKFKDNFYMDTIIGIVLLEVIGLIPYVGGTLKFIAFLIGLGMIREEWKRTHKE